MPLRYRHDCVACTVCCSQYCLQAQQLCHHAGDLDTNIRRFRTESHRTQTTRHFFSTRLMVAKTFRHQRQLVVNCYRFMPQALWSDCAAQKANQLSSRSRCFKSQQHNAGVPLILFESDKIQNKWSAVQLSGSEQKPGSLQPCDELPHDDAQLRLHREQCPSIQQPNAEPYCGRYGYVNS